MTWNYRIVRTIHPDYPDTPDFRITEVFYEDDGSIMGWVDPIDYSNQTGESVEELRSNYEYMMLAFDAPVLEAVQPDGADVPTLVEVTA